MNMTQTISTEAKQAADKIQSLSVYERLKDDVIRVRNNRAAHEQFIQFAIDQATAALRRDLVTAKTEAGICSDGRCGGCYECLLAQARHYADSAL